MGKIDKKALKPAWLLVICMVAVTACGGSSKEASPTVTTSPASTSTTIQQPADATAVINDIKATGVPVAETETYTAENDPNHQLGRPNGYTSKVNFHDARFEMKKDDAGLIDSSSGGSVEVFADHAGAQARSDYITSVTKGMSAVTEYDYVEGSTLLRLSQIATPDQAGVYRDALKAHHVGQG